MSEQTRGGECRAFHWIGQDFASCDNCGRDIREHDGMHGPPSTPFGRDDERVVPFPEMMQRSPLFAHYVTPTDAPRPYQREAQ